MMAVVTVFHSIRGSILIVVILALGLIGWRIQKSSHADGLVSRLLVADINKVPEIIDELDEYRHWTDPQLLKIMGKSESLPKERLRASLALLPVDEGQIDYLFPYLLQAEPDDLLIIRKQMAPNRAKVVDAMWPRLRDNGTNPNQRLRLACMLAAYDPNKETCR